MPDCSQWFWIARDQDGVAQIASKLDGLSDISAVHIVSHGSDATLFLGCTQLAAENIDHYRPLLEAIGKKLNSDADVLLYGCNVSESKSGVEFTRLLADILKADVASSTTFTGSSLFGGDWVLEIQTGPVATQALNVGLLNVLSVLRGTEGDDTLTGGNADDTIEGKLGADILDGGKGQDFISGGDGADSIFGGEGNDTYVVDNSAEQVMESAGEGTDTVQSSVTFTLTDNLENLTLTGTGAIVATGNSSANTLTGNAGNNALTAGDGDDKLLAGAGNDTLNGGAGADSMEGGTGNDTLIGGFGKDKLTGGDGQDLFFSDR